MASKRKRAHGSPRRRPDRPPDPRLTATQIAENVDTAWGNRFEKGDWVVQLAPLRLPGGQVFYYHSPEMVAFSLIEGKGHADRGERLRLQVSKQIRDDHLSNESLVLDCLAECRIAVFLAFAAIESLGNAAVDQLPPEAEVEVERERAAVRVPRDAMVRRLSVREKLDLVVPLVAGQPSIKGTKPWESFRRLRRLRDDLVHVEARGYSSDPDNPSVLGRLLLGEARTCIQDAAEVVRAAFPGWMVPEVAAE